jgi:hypothetical protein
MLNPVPVNIYLEKSGLPFLPTGPCKPADPTGEQHTPHTTPIPTPWEYNPAQPLGRLNTLPTKLKSINGELYSNNDSKGGRECWTCPGEWEWGKEQNCQWMKVGKVTKAESRGGVTSQAPKVRRWWIAELVSWDWELYSKLNCPTLLGEELTSQSCSCRAMQLSPGENNIISDHIAQTGSEWSRVPIATCHMDRRN